MSQRTLAAGFLKWRQFGDGFEQTLLRFNLLFEKVHYVDAGMQLYAEKEVLVSCISFWERTGYVINDGVPKWWSSCVAGMRCELEMGDRASLAASRSDYVP